MSILTASGRLRQSKGLSIIKIHPPRSCAHCHGSIKVTARADSKFCSVSCRSRSRHARIGADLAELVRLRAEHTS
ncbi:hypothetical protein [Flexivirga sp.]|uniref:hypothetical protein n=1 Tax=Flexivirga sp. TaxID=1962927 RepID=UPI003F8213CC